jgi:serine/threonine protein kinase
VVERELGLGLFGRVMLARDKRLGEPVVLKEYQGFAGAAASGAFAREAKALGQLEHRNVVEVRDVFREGDDLYVAMEWLPDGSLEDRLRAGPMPAEEALDILQQVLAALAEAHRRGIVHRDVKPSNILFRGARAKLADFGIALDPVLDGALRAAQGQPGTLGWMAPEQAAGEGAGPASDVHAAGAVLYRMLEGRHYLDLEGLGEQAARRAVKGRRPRLPLRHQPAEVNALLARALAKDPGDRFADAGAMLKEVRRAREALAPSGKPGPRSLKDRPAHAPA